MVKFKQQQAPLASQFPRYLMVKFKQQQAPPASQFPRYLTVKFKQQQVPPASRFPRYPTDKFKQQQRHPRLQVPQFRRFQMDKFKQQQRLQMPPQAHHPLLLSPVPETDSVSALLLWLWVLLPCSSCKIEQHSNSWRESVFNFLEA
jgi:hypothetical protein